MTIDVLGLVVRMPLPTDEAHGLLCTAQPAKSVWPPLVYGLVRVKSAGEYILFVKRLLFARDK